MAGNGEGRKAISQATSAFEQLARGLAGNEAVDRQKRIARQAEIQTSVKAWMQIGVQFVVSACIIVAAILGVIWLGMVVLG